MVVQEVAVDRQVGPCDAEHGGFQPFRVGVVRLLPGARFRRNRMSVMTAVPSRLNASDGRRMAPRKSAWAASMLADGRVLLVEREMAGDHGEDAAGFQGFDRLGDEKVVEGELLAVEVELDVGEGDVADHGVERRELGIAEVLDADVGLGMEGAGDAAGDAVEFDADEPLACRGMGHEIARCRIPARARGASSGHAQTRKGLVHGRHDDGGGEELAEGRPLGAVVLLGGEERLEFLADGLPAVLEPAGDGIGEDREGDGPEAAESAEGLHLVVGGRAVLPLDGLEACGWR